MLFNNSCVFLCKMELSKFDTNNFIWMIDRDYKVNMYKKFYNIEKLIN